MCLTLPAHCTGEDDEIDEKFWAQAVADNAADPNQDDMGFGPIPFSTQFFHDEDDGDDPPGFDDGGMQDAPAAMDEEDLIAATQGTLKRVRPEHINYTKRAKRVDVRMLKENIWKGLNIVVPHGAEDEVRNVVGPGSVRVDLEYRRLPHLTSPKPSRRTQPRPANSPMSFPTCAHNIQRIN